MPELGGLRHVEHAMGTVFSFDIRDEPTPALRRGLAAATAWLHHVDEVFSTYRPDSQISRLGRGECTVADCDPDVAEVLQLCEETAGVSGGWFSVRPEGRLDPSAVVKGWAIERASRLLREAGSRAHCVNGGGDLQLAGGAGGGAGDTEGPDRARPWRIGVADPLRPSGLATIVTGWDFAVATSGTAERGYHILDPHMGRPATALASVTLVGRGLSTVDGLSTAAFAMGDAAREWVEDTLDGVEAFAVTADGRTWWTSGFPRYGRVPH